MEHLKHFFKQKGLYLALLACIVAAAAACFLAIRDVMEQLRPAPAPKPQIQEEDLWNHSSQPVTGEVKDLPIADPTPVPAAELPQRPAAPSGWPTPPDASAEESESGEAPELPPESDDSLIWPVDGSITQGYSGDELVYNATLRDWRTHNGVDIAAQQGCRVVAPEDGTLTALYADAMWGYVAELTAGERVWRCCGLDGDTDLTVGQSLRAGDTLGRLLTPDAETDSDSHLHLELTVNGRPADPAELLE